MEEYADDIEVLTVAEGVCRRAESYVGPLDNPLLPNLLLLEAICCARDEVLKGIAQRVEIDPWEDGRARVRDYGPGLPPTMHSNGKRLAETFLTVLYACASAKSNDQVAESTCDFGLLALNALCSALTLRIFAAGQEWRQEYQAGKAVTALDVVGSTFIPIGASNSKMVRIPIRFSSVMDVTKPGCSVRRTKSSAILTRHRSMN